VSKEFWIEKTHEHRGHHAKIAEGLRNGDLNDANKTSKEWANKLVKYKKITIQNIL
jgi:hypothetical protein